mmetsp:Transcript_3428/g.7970  ORF Transcript_3428/g.7970 Transcript_3428/m.7970 type:complete len:308 (+) Transcript_3428:1503-2426(+)
MAAKLAAKKAKAEEVPFRTKAMREVEALERQPVFTKAIVRLVFPDRSCLVASLSPLESAKAALSALVAPLLVKSQGAANGAENLAFELFTTPPREALPAQGTLGELGLVPAAVVHVAILPGSHQPPPGEGSSQQGQLPWFFNGAAASLMEATVRRVAQERTQPATGAAYPTSTSLAPAQAQAHEDRRAAALAAARGLEKLLEDAVHPPDPPSLPRLLPEGFDPPLEQGVVPDHEAARLVQDGDHRVHERGVYAPACEERLERDQEVAHRRRHALLERRVPILLEGHEDPFPTVDFSQDEKHVGAGGQ